MKEIKAETPTGWSEEYLAIRNSGEGLPVCPTCGKPYLMYCGGRPNYEGEVVGFGIASGLCVILLGLAMWWNSIPAMIFAGIMVIIFGAFFAGAYDLLKSIQRKYCEHTFVNL